MKISKKLIVLPFLVFSLTGCKEKEKTFTVTWKNYDGKVLEVDKNVKEGTMPHYDGGTPTKAKTASQVFNFKGWSPKLVKVTKNATYTAQFNEEVRKYEVKWLDDDAETVLHSEEVEYGTTPSHPTDIEKNDGDYVYTLQSWDREPEVVQGNQSYIATFSQSSKCKYTCKFYDEDGETLLQTVENVDFDKQDEIYTEAEPTKEGDDDVIYEFVGFEELPRDKENFVRTFKAKYFEATNPAKFKITEYSTWCKIDGFADGKSATNLVFPHKINGLQVSSISESAFELNTTIESIYIPNSVNYVNRYAFDRCTSVTNIEFELGQGTATQLSIYDSAFRGTNHGGTFVIPSRILGSGSVAQYGIDDMYKVSAFAIEEHNVANPYYLVKDGVFFSERGKCLHTYPYEKRDTSYIVPEEVTSFNIYVGIHNKYVESIEFKSKGNLTLRSYVISCSNLSSITFDKECTLTLEWYVFSGSPIRSLILPANTTVQGGTFGNCGSTEDESLDVFFEGTSAENWYTGSGGNGPWYNHNGSYVNVYIYSESEAVDAGDLPEHFAGSWHYVNDVPTVWNTL